MTFAWEHEPHTCFVGAVMNVIGPGCVVHTGVFDLDHLHVRILMVLVG